MKKMFCLIAPPCSYALRAERKQRQSLKNCVRKICLLRTVWDSTPFCGVLSVFISAA